MPKKKFNPDEAAKKFISGVTPVAQSQETPEKPKLTHKSYYITPEQYKKIRLYAVENDTDASSVIRAAIDLYFKSV
jgi:hypothetical protein